MAQRPGVSYGSSFGIEAGGVRTTPTSGTRRVRESHPRPPPLGTVVLGARFTRAPARRTTLSRAGACGYLTHTSFGVQGDLRLQRAISLGVGLRGGRPAPEVWLDRPRGWLSFPRRAGRRSHHRSTPTSWHRREWSRLRGWSGRTSHVIVEEIGRPSTPLFDVCCCGTSFSKSHRSELNRRPLDYESRALPLSYGGVLAVQRLTALVESSTPWCQWWCQTRPVATSATRPQFIDKGLDAVLHRLSPVAHLAQVPVDLPHHGFTPVTHFPSHGEDAHRRPLVEALEPSGAVGVPEHLGADLPALWPARSAMASRSFRKSVTIASSPVR